MFAQLPKQFDYATKTVFGKEIKILQNCCTKPTLMSCGGGGGCGGGSGTSNPCGGGYSGGCGGGSGYGNTIIRPGDFAKDALKKLKKKKKIRKSMQSCGSTMFLNVTNECNLGCYFCIADRDKQMISDFGKLDSSLSELISQGVIDKVVLTGGEPLMHPKFSTFLNMLDEFPLQHYSLNTNGTLLPYHLDAINASELKHINISMHHFTDAVNRKIMGRGCLQLATIPKLRKEISANIEIRLAATITQHLHTEEDILAYTKMAKSLGIDSVIFRNEYKGFDRHLTAFQRIWGDMFTADICNCAVKIINGVRADYRESNVRLKQAICEAGLYFRDFIYQANDTLGGSWE
ncbi:radical SAM protein, partial [bacterium]|nr:radical SAM protein [bacterium]